MESKVKLAFVLPTCEPDTMLTYLAPSIKYLEPIKEIIKFCIVFQPPYTEDLVQKALTYFKGFNVESTFKTYDCSNGRVPLIKIRNDCALMEPKAPLYACIDDDMKFKEGLDSFYFKAISDFELSSNLGVISFSTYIHHCRMDNYFATNKGIIYRGGVYYGFDGLVPEKLMDSCKTLIPYEGENLLELIGGQQDKFCALIRLATGQTSKLYLNVPCTHEENRKMHGKDQFHWIDVEFDEKSVTSFIRKYFNPRFCSKLADHCFDQKLNDKIYPKNDNFQRSQIVFSLDGTIREKEPANATTRIEDEYPIFNRKGILLLDFKITKAEDYKEFTIMQVLSLDGRAKPIIRISIIDKIICVTYKDENNINHYTKIDNFELDKNYIISIEVDGDVISIQGGKWKYPNWANEMKFKYGIYPQTENGTFEMVIDRLKIKK